MSVYNMKDHFRKVGIPICILKSDLYDPEAVRKREPHAHEFVEIAFVAGGRGYHQLNGQKSETSRGDIFIINFDTIHLFSPLDEANSGNLEIINCIFMLDFLNDINIEPDLMKEITSIFLFNSMYEEELPIRPGIRLTGETLGNVDAILARMLREYEVEFPGFIGVLKSLLVDLLINIYRGYRGRKETFDRGEKYRYGIIWEAVDYLKRNYDSKLNLDEVCQHFYLSKSYFTKVFKKATGMSAFEYLQHIRMKEACRLLTETGRKITDIAETVGYMDYNFFNRTFKKITGVTALQYRKTHPPA